jgi:cell wall-associated NlpC family hydrolase
VSTGSGNYLDRVKLYHAHVGEWRQQFEKLDSVDLRYERQIVVNPDLRSTTQPVALSPAAARAAVTAGVPAVAMTAAALVKRQQANAKPLLVAAKTTTKIPAKVAIGKIPAPKSASPKSVTPKSVTPKTVTPKTVTPKTVTPKTVTPKTVPRLVKPVLVKEIKVKPVVARPVSVKPVVKVHHTVKKAPKKAVHKRGKATKHAARKSPASQSAAKTVRHASSKTATAPVLVLAKPHQLTGTIKSANGGKPHAAIVSQ